MTQLEICLALAIFSFSIFVLYNLIAIGIFGIPWSLSRTYYLYENEVKNGGIAFTVFMWVMGMTMMPGMIIIGEMLGSWMRYFCFLAFITCACIVFVGTAPRYYQDLEGKVHMIAAKVCAASALLWDFLVCWNIWYVPLCAMVIPVVIGACTKTWKECRDYWLEMMAFDATFAVIITELMLLINK